ncbi:hypothetical protein MKEN_00443800 [Mycena kentingensis (nom. inval.)]|nr:hypothetical protein MKEN_00443800 [Mycena kentingensis (nom. inval.)]
MDRLRRQVHQLQQESADKEVKIVQLNKQHGFDKENISGLNIALDSGQQELELVMKRKLGVRGTAGSTPAQPSKNYASTSRFSHLLDSQSWIASSVRFVRLGNRWRERKRRQDVGAGQEYASQCVDVQGSNNDSYSCFHGTAGGSLGKAASFYWNTDPISLVAFDFCATLDFNRDAGSIGASTRCVCNS